MNRIIGAMDYLMPYGYYTSDSLRFVARGVVNVPSNVGKYDVNRFPHWHTFRILHIGANMERLKLEVVKNNLKIIASIDKSEINYISIEKLIEMGLLIGLKELT